MPRPVQDQIVVITGASSGIGRETALAFGRKGASVVLAARSEQALRSAADQIERDGGHAHVVVTDVAEWDQMLRLAQEAVTRFGRIDTWINNAAIAAYGTVEEMNMDEIERILRVNLLGQIHGVKAVLPYMKRQGEGTIINVASALAERAVPLQSAYVAAKHAIKGFTESLRLELEHEKSNIHVSLVLPSSFNTPLFDHARSKMGAFPQPVPPIYEPSIVADTLLYLAEHPRHKVVIGAAKMLTLLQRISPRLADWYMLQGGRLWRQQKTDWPDDHRDNLFEPMPDTGTSRGRFGEQAISISPYTRYLELYPNRVRALTAALLLGAVGLVFWAGRRSND